LGPFTFSSEAVIVGDGAFPTFAAGEITFGHKWPKVRRKTPPGVPKSTLVSLGKHSAALGRWLEKYG
jgi:hypothetical protein